MSETILRRGLLAPLFVAGLSAAAVAQQGAKLQGFPTADAAAAALTEAIRRNDDKAIRAIVGEGWLDFLIDEKDDPDRERAAFLAAWDAKHAVVADGNKATIEVGNDGIDFTSYADADANGANGNQYDLDSILVHEFGHSLGLDHSTVATQVTMYASIGANDFSKARLDDDDVNGGRFVYVNGYHAVNYAPGTQLVCDPLFLGLSTPTFKGNSSVYLRVTIVDENGNLVSGASVTVTVTRPNGTTGTGTASTNADGQVVFNSGKAQHGAYSAAVTAVTKPGMTFNAGAGKSTDTATF